jgi:hypothetical protein
LEGICTLGVFNIYSDKSTLSGSIGLKRKSSAVRMLPRRADRAAILVAPPLVAVAAIGIRLIISGTLSGVSDRYFSAPKAIDDQPTKPQKFWLMVSRTERSRHEQS